MKTQKLIKLIKGTVDPKHILLVYVKIDDNILTVSDSNIFLKIWLYLATENIDRKGLIHYKDFINAIETIKDYDIEIKDKARIFNETKSVELALGKIDDYVKKPDTSKSKRIGVTGLGDFEKILIAQKFVDSKKSLKQALQNVYVGEDIVATNAHYMYFEKVSEPDFFKEPYLLPLKVAKLIKIIGDEPISIRANEDFIELSFSNAKITYKIPKMWNNVIAKFPDYKKVIPTKHSTKVKVDKKEFADRITKAVKFVPEVPHKIRIAIHQKLSINSFDADNAQAYNSNIPADKTGKDLISEFNGKFMLRILKSIKDEKVTLKFNRANDAIVIQDKFLLMPLLDRMYKKQIY